MLDFQTSKTVLMYVPDLSTVTFFTAVLNLVEKCRAFTEDLSGAVFDFMCIAYSACLLCCYILNLFISVLV